MCKSLFFSTRNSWDPGSAGVQNCSTQARNESSRHSDTDGVQGRQLERQLCQMQSTSCCKTDQQIAVESLQETDLYAPVLKAIEARLMLAVQLSMAAR
jgi:hypothetical protein